MVEATSRAAPERKPRWMRLEPGGARAPRFGTGRVGSQMDEDNILPYCTPQVSLHLSFYRYQISKTPVLLYFSTVVEINS